MANVRMAALLAAALAACSPKVAPAPSPPAPSAPVAVAAADAGAPAPPRDVPVQDAAFAEPIAEARALVHSLLDSGVPGLSVAVAVDGRVVWAEPFGVADVATGAPVTVTTEFRIGSVSKCITAVVAALLVEDGKLDLDAPIQTYVPAFPVKPWPITARELGGHLAGVRHYRGREALSAKAYASVTDGLAIFADDPLLFEPGTKWAYSSYGFNLLSAALETAAGQPFLDLVHARVIAPLHLEHTEPEHATVATAGRTSFYELEDGHATVAPFVDNSNKWASGGYLSTPLDLVRFGSALLAPGLVKPASKDLLFTSMQTRDGAATHYGFGWFVNKARTRVFHSGGSIGGSTELVLVPAQKVVVAVVANVSSDKSVVIDADAMATAFAAAADHTR